MAFGWFILVGLSAGWLAGQFMKGGGFGVIDATEAPVTLSSLR